MVASVSSALGLTGGGLEAPSPREKQAEIFQCLIPLVPQEAQLSCSHLPAPTTSRGGDVGQNVVGENKDSAGCSPTWVPLLQNATSLLHSATEIKMRVTTEAKACPWD